MKRETSTPFDPATASVPGKRTCRTMASIARNAAALHLIPRLITVRLAERTPERISFFAAVLKKPRSFRAGAPATDRRE